MNKLISGTIRWFKKASRHFIEEIKKNIIIYMVIFISGYALYLRLIKLAGHKLWGDELSQISYAQMPFIDFIKNMPRIEFCSYISLNAILTYPFIRLFLHNKWLLTIPQLISTILGFYLLYLVCKLHFKTIWGYLITFTVFCFNTTLIWHATEIRPYAILPTLALGVFYVSQVLTGQVVGLKKKWLLGAFLVLAIWFHLYGIVMVFLCLTYSFAEKLHSPMFKAALKKNKVLLTVVFSIAMPLWLFSIFGPHFPYPRISCEFDFIPNPIINISGFVKAIFGNLLGFKKMYFLFIGVLFPFFIPYKERFSQIGFLFITVIIPIQLIFLSDLHSGYYFVQRQFIWVMPFFAFFLGWVWDSFFMLLKGKSIKLRKAAAK